MWLAGKATTPLQGERRDNTEGGGDWTLDTSLDGTPDDQRSVDPRCTVLYRSVCSKYH
jgi:hypothetical protein